MQFSDNVIAANPPDDPLRQLVAYKILKPVFEWLKRQKTLHPQWLDCALDENFDTNLKDVMIYIRRMYAKDNRTSCTPISLIAMCCKITYEPSKAVLVVQCWADRWWIVARDYPDTIEIPIAEPSMFELIREHLDRLQLALIFMQKEFTEQSKAATDGHEIPTQSAG